MQKELLNYIRENKLSPFNRTKTSVNGKAESIYKTKDAKTIHNKLLSTLRSARIKKIYTIHI
jgi:fibrillarin-like rRNA methylase